MEHDYNTCASKNKKKIKKIKKIMLCGGVVKGSKINT
jgi:hypothetical protein